ncbi:hypothetical protein BDB00DRAFT_878107 [Zychaea mexicana]|uniref:uncharacterized protein n=1 Tax=Zychaea mexicana TaxID=64656 RepID=UPI0022FDBAD4|nr:uncharacterized protein BDB00DRAFT_878107 [Zychaea mexicana]KAI9485078.1 hypothetical protein BDB00DRAFT_878107 [Zychaea mexicana]
MGFLLFLKADPPLLIYLPDALPQEIHRSNDKEDRTRTRNASFKSILPAAASALQSAFRWFASFLPSPSASSSSASSASSSSIATTKDDNHNRDAFELTADDIALVISAAVSVVETAVSVVQAAASLIRTVFLITKLTVRTTLLLAKATLWAIKMTCCILKRYL